MFELPPNLVCLRDAEKAYYIVRPNSHQVHRKIYHIFKGRARLMGLFITGPAGKGQVVICGEL